MIVRRARSGYRGTAFSFSAGVAMLVAAAPAAADPTPAGTISHPSSPCVVERSAGEYPRYVVKRDGRSIYAPTSDGIVVAAFSPDGRYIAFSGSEISGVDIEPGRHPYSVVVLECRTGALRGFERGVPEPDLAWRGHSALRFTDAATGKPVELAW